jgi:hypothetical protein
MKDEYPCMVGCKTCNFVPNDVLFTSRQEAAAIIHHKAVIGDDYSKKIRANVRGDAKAFSSFFNEHQSHELVLVDKDGIHKPELEIAQLR